MFNILSYTPGNRPRCRQLKSNIYCWPWQQSDSAMCHCMQQLTFWLLLLLAAGVHPMVMTGTSTPW